VYFVSFPKIKQKKSSKFIFPQSRAPMKKRTAQASEETEQPALKKAKKADGKEGGGAKQEKKIEEVKKKEKEKKQVKKKEKKIEEEKEIEYYSTAEQLKQKWPALSPYTVYFEQLLRDGYCVIPKVVEADVIRDCNKNLDEIQARWNEVVQDKPVKLPGIHGLMVFSFIV
jgi:hypothetical protein